MPRTSKDSTGPQRRQRSSHQPSLPGYIGGLRRSRRCRWHSYWSLWCRLHATQTRLRYYNVPIPRRPAMRATDLGPPLTKALCCISAFDTPPRAVPKLTPICSCGLSAEYSKPLSARASLTEATANCAYRSNRFNRCGEKYSSGFQSSTSAELVALNTDGSNLE